MEIRNCLLKSTQMPKGLKPPLQLYNFLNYHHSLTIHCEVCCGILLAVFFCLSLFLSMFEKSNNSQCPVSGYHENMLKIANDIIPNLVVVESQEVQVGHLIDPRRYSDELVMIKAQFHHGVEGAKKRFRFNSLTVQFVVGEVQVFQTRVHMGKNKTCAAVGRKHWPWVFFVVPLVSDCTSEALKSENCCEG